MCAYYPESRVEISGFIARHYDWLLNLSTFGRYSPFIQNAIKLMNIKPEDKILDLGTGTGKNACIMMQYLSRKGELTGVDISDDMISQFNQNCSKFSNARIIKKRIDRGLGYKGIFNKIFISFVLHGFPQKAREKIIENAFNSLKTKGKFFILDYNEFKMEEKPLLVKMLFNIIECPYAFDFIKRDWKKLLSLSGFTNIEEHLFFNGYVRLLAGTKI